VPALVVDEAQSLSHELLEELRLLTNTYSPSECSLALILVGQPELAQRLKDGTLRQLRQRISLRCELRRFELKETAAYIAVRIRIAGASAEALFTRDAIVAVHERSGGIPRNINVICDNALVTGFAADVRPVGRDIVLEVCRDFEFEAAPAAAGSADTPAMNGGGSRNGKLNGSTVGVSDDSTVGRVPALVADERPMFSGLIRPRRFSFF
jgi:hypothetical protein